jgi:hypothetical protein
MAVGMAFLGNGIGWDGCIDDEPVAWMDVSYDFSRQEKW